MTRRRWLALAGVAVAAPFVAAYGALVGRTTALRSSPRRVTIPADLQQDVTFVEDLIVCRTAGGVRVMSARCTHLGCQISRQADGVLVCPCHGSRFRLDGSVAQGPAARPLETLQPRVDPRTGALIVLVT
jgi:Rieske Fe-S protein